ncbi:hypothetical protein F4774DRAFT_383287 [Daldinia eschscholtzii]|nr:hypothetical protein F4774DRAFT_383287 [Daldinia eschscholtzii]
MLESKPVLSCLKSLNDSVCLFRYLLYNLIYSQRLGSSHIPRHSPNSFISLSGQLVLNLIRNCTIVKTQTTMPPKKNNQRTTFRRKENTPNESDVSNSPKIDSPISSRALPPYLTDDVMSSSGSSDTTSEKSNSSKDSNSTGVDERSGFGEKEIMDLVRALSKAEALEITYRSQTPKAYPVYLNPHHSIKSTIVVATCTFGLFVLIDIAMQPIVGMAIGQLIEFIGGILFGSGNMANVVGTIGHEF